MQSKEITKPIRKMQSSEDEAREPDLSLIGINPREVFELGARAAQSGDWNTAVQCYRRVTQLAPQVEAGHFNLGNALFELARFREAADAYRAALALSDDPASWNNLGNALSELQESEDAAAAYVRALRSSSIPPELASQCFFHLGRVQLALARYSDAADSFCRSWEKAPGNPRPVERGLRTLGLLREWDRGVRLGEEALAHDRCKIDACFGLSALWEERDRWDLALSYLVQAVDWFPEDPRTFSRLAQHHARRGRVSEATACIHRAATLREPSAELFSHWIQMLQLSSVHHPNKVRDEAKNWRVAKSGPTRSSVPPFGRAHPTRSETKNGEDEVVSSSPQTTRGRRIAVLVHEEALEAIVFQLLPYLKQRDRSLHSIHIYWCSLDEHPIQKELQPLVDQWSMSHQWTDASIAGRMEAERSDILVDMIGHGPSTRLGVGKLQPAKVNVFWNYSQQTSGQPDFAFRLLHHSDPAAFRHEATESAVVVNYPAMTESDLPPEEFDPALDETSKILPLRFGFCGAMKWMTHESLDFWASLLAAFPDSSLTLLSSELRSQGTDGEIRDGFARRGILESRICVDSDYDPSSFASIAKWCQGLDVFVTSLPVASMPSPLAALSTGCSVAGLLGDSAPRSGLAPLQSLLPESVVLGSTVPECIDALRGKLEQLRVYRQQRVERRHAFLRSPLAKGDVYARSIDDAWLEVIDRFSRVNA
ncbi:Tetratricopeptide repeat protein [Pirellula sp. SH-Sr6A]|nr:Tetratricopeptide repeat protein [Pirellula sp. SH-Sr6A]